MGGTRLDVIGSGRLVKETERRDVISFVFEVYTGIGIIAVWLLLMDWSYSLVYLLVPQKYIISCSFPNRAACLPMSLSATIDL